MGSHSDERGGAKRGGAHNDKKRMGSHPDKRGGAHMLTRGAGHTLAQQGVSSLIPRPRHTGVGRPGYEARVRVHTDLRANWVLDADDPDTGQRGHHGVLTVTLPVYVSRDVFGDVPGN